MKGVGLWVRPIDNPKAKAKLFAVVFQKDEDIIGEIEQIAFDRHLQVEERVHNFVEVSKPGRRNK
jgi:hypothetical protein